MFYQPCFNSRPQEPWLHYSGEVPILPPPPPPQRRALGWRRILFPRNLVSSVLEPSISRSSVQQSGCQQSPWQGREGSWGQRLAGSLSLSCVSLHVNSFAWALHLSFWLKQALFDYAHWAGLDIKAKVRAQGACSRSCSQLRAEPSESLSLAFDRWCNDQLPLPSSEDSREPAVQLLREKGVGCAQAAHCFVLWLRIMFPKPARKRNNRAITNDCWARNCGRCFPFFNCGHC